MCVFSRNLIPGLAVWWQSGDHSLQSSWTRVQEAASLHISRRQWDRVRQVAAELAVVGKPKHTKKNELLKILISQDLSDITTSRVSLRGVYMSTAHS